MPRPFPDFIPRASDPLVNTDASYQRQTYHLANLLKMGVAGDLVVRLAGDGVMRRFSGMPAGSQPHLYVRYVGPDTTADNIQSLYRESAFIEGETMRGYLNAVEQFGCNPDGLTDNTAALLRCQSNSNVGDTIYFPPGVYLTDVDVQVWQNRNYTGGLSTVTGNSIIRARGAGTNLVSVPTAANISNLTFDGNSLADYSLYNPASFTTLQNIIARRATLDGIWYDESEEVLGINVMARENGRRGHYILGANGSVFTMIQSKDNIKEGVDVAGINSLETTSGGQVSIFGGTFQNNNEAAGNEGPQLSVRGVEGGTYSSLYLEGGKYALNVDQNARNALFQQLRMNSPIAGGRAVLLRQARLCTFQAFIAEDSPAGYEQFYCPSPSDIGGNTFIGNTRGSDFVNEFFPIIYDNGIITYTWYGTPNGPASLSVPTLGQWPTGTIVWNMAGGAAGGILGWRCRIGGTPGTWETMPF